MRDDFPSSIKDVLARRVGYRCCNPDCCKLTSGPHEESTKAINIGVAAHITAAAPGGKRYDRHLSSEERRAIENGIWLCQNCGKLIDSDEQKYSVELLRNWKRNAEQQASVEVETRFSKSRSLQQAFHEGDQQCNELLPTTTHKSATLNVETVTSYLQSLSSHYERWWDIYRLTDVISARQATFTFEQIAQTEEPSKEAPTSKKTVLLPQLLQGIIDYAESEPVLLVGSPGVGKSTILLRLLALLASQELQKSATRIPVLIRLKDYQPSPPGSEDSSGILALIKEALKPELPLEISEVKTLLFQEKRLFLLLVQRPINYAT